MIPSELWTRLWEILSSPPRVEELIARKYPDRLRAYQVEGVQRLIEKERFILADEMGVGKTVQVCVALSLLIRLARIKTALIICPKTVLSVWHEHLKAWLREAETHPYSHVHQLRLAQREGRPQVWVVPYSRLAKRGAALTWGSNWDVVVLDEVHEIRNPDTNKHREIKVVIAHARYRWGLSGTPLQNRIEELTAIFSVIKPELKLQADGKPLHQVREIIRPYLRRVRRKDAVPDLPPKQRQEFWLEMDEAQARAYHAVRNGARTGLGGGRPVTFTHIWQVLTELKKICNFAPDSSDSPKLRKLLEIIEKVVARGEKVVVFSQFRAVGVTALTHHLNPFGAAVIHGERTDEERHQAVRRFQHDPDCKIFLCTVQTGGHGLTLTAANHVVHFDHWWNPAVSWQAEDRVCRIGQTRPVTVYDLWMKDTVEERIRKLLEVKGLLHYEVIECLSDSEFKKLFTLDDLLSLLEDGPLAG
ncbi:MAG: DEAD/DEAH box helicase [Thermogutta sp.]|nr:DEAD/DEAH box helicase [Thermogutta sp.]